MITAVKVLHALSDAELRVKRLWNIMHKIAKLEFRVDFLKYSTLHVKNAWKILLSE